MKVPVTESEATSRCFTVSSKAQGAANSSRDRYSLKVLWVVLEWFSQTRIQEPPLTQHCSLWALRGYIRDVPETFLKTGATVTRKAATAITQALGH